MLKTIKIFNFQSHKKTEMEFSPGVNAIVGEGDVGKTAAWRALVWVILNTPQGWSFQSWWGGDTQIWLEFEEAVIVRRRTKSKNEYQIDDADPLKKVGKGGPPEEVERIINMDPAINIRRQHEQHFLLPNTPADRARILNKAAKIDEIDTAMSKINSRQQTNSSTLKGTKTSLDITKDQLKGFDGLNELDGRVAMAEVLERRRNTFNKDSETLIKLMSDSDWIQKELTEIGLITAIPIDKWIKQMEVFKTLRNQCTTLFDMVVQIKDIEVKIELSKSFQSLEIEYTSALAEKLETIVSKGRMLKEMVIRLEGVETELQGAQEIRASASKKLTQLMPDKCPLCERSCSCVK